uniref:Mce/MlaD domain-containing protein n=1 Tax=Sonderella linearis TaxID=110477 RepID=A0A1Z1MMK4_9FLOR|nr:hypothetical protein [Sonderella linearis]ARW66991.1 hypothetical protein [Sonderella linearis]
MVYRIKFNYEYFIKCINKSISLLVFILFTIVLILFFSNIKKKKGYKLFIEFSNAYGIKIGTSVYFRGIKIGYITKINIQFNTIVVLLYIQSSKILIPKNSIIEVNQVGLFNDVVIDIIPLEWIHFLSIKHLDVLSLSCLDSSFLCSDFYIKGYKGINYDDLVRATTRIAQRFDDPRFFYLFYLFLQNIIDISDEVMFSLNHISYISYFCIEFIQFFLLEYLF